MAEFHFLRPIWLILFPLGVWFIWKLTRTGGSLGRWQAFVDEALQPYVLTAPDLGLRRHRACISGMSDAFGCSSAGSCGGRLGGISQLRKDAVGPSQRGRSRCEQRHQARGL